VFKIRRIARDNHVGIDEASGFMQHSVLEVFEWQIQGAFQSGFVHRGDFEKGKQKRDTLTCPRSSDGFSNEIMERCNSCPTQPTLDLTCLNP